eukprot:1160701-Pelagomonas_calceolata.AAC.10
MFCLAGAVSASQWHEQMSAHISLIHHCEVCASALCIMSRSVHQPKASLWSVHPMHCGVQQQQQQQHDPAQTALPCTLIHVHPLDPIHNNPSLCSLLFTLIYAARARNKEGAGQARPHKQRKGFLTSRSKAHLQQGVRRHHRLLPLLLHCTLCCTVALQLCIRMSGHHPLCKVGCKAGHMHG